MKDNLVLIENNCGLKPADQELIEIGSDPNFVFCILRGDFFFFNNVNVFETFCVF